MPNVKVAHIDKAMTNISVSYMQDAADFIADKVFPQVPVKKQSDIYFIYDKGSTLRDAARIRANGGESAGGGYEVTQAPPYYCEVHAFHIDVTAQDRANYDKPLDADIDATEAVTNKMLIRREVEWATQFFIDTVWTRVVTGVDATPDGDQAIKFNLATSTPIQDITDEIITIASQTGKRPNGVCMSPNVFYALKNHEDILDRIKYTEKGIVTSALLAALFEVDEVHVAWGIVNAGKEGAADAIDFIMGKHMLLYHKAKKPALKTPSAGYIFTWTGLEGAGAYGNRIVRIPMDLLGLGTERIEGEIAFDAKVTGADLAAFFKGIVD